MSDQNYDPNHIERLANEYRKMLMSQPGLSELTDPLDRISDISENLIVIRFPTDESVSGYSYNIGDYMCIFINSAHNLGRQYCTFWHEFYHVMNDDRDDRTIQCSNYDLLEEDEANYFAYCMLLPKNEVKERITLLNKSIHDINIVDLIHIQYAMRVSMQVLLFRLKEIYQDNHFMKLLSYTKPDKEMEFDDLIKACGYELDLVKPTNDFCLPKSFFINLYRNIENGKLSIDHAEFLLKMLDEKEAKWIW